MVVASEEILVLSTPFMYQVKGEDELLQMWSIASNMTTGYHFHVIFTFTTIDLTSIHTVFYGSKKFHPYFHTVIYLMLCWQLSGISSGNLHLPTTLRLMHMSYD